MSLNLDELLARGNAGDVEAQRELAIRFHNGDGVEYSEDAARAWLRVAAINGDAWSQRMHATVLRATEEPEKERESVYWLTLSAQQGDNEARYYLGAQQFLGVGTDVDVEAAAVNFVLASLNGHEMAQSAFRKIVSRLQPDSWESISARVNWAQLTFVMGKSADSVGPGGIVPFQTDDEWEVENSRWLQDEQEVADATFHPDAKPSLLDAAFGTAVTVTKFHVGRTIVDGEKLFATTISLQHILQSDLTPVWWKPSLSTLEDTAVVIALIHGRQWIKTTYTSY